MSINYKGEEDRLRGGCVPASRISKGVEDTRILIVFTLLKKFKMRVEKCKG